jgi:Kef-type K+ transport system membrane component KefB/nucleotide-binding universal stress UspA family protein
VLTTTLAVFAWQPVEYGNVSLGTVQLFVITNTKLMSAAERAEQINDRLKSIVADPKLDPAKLEIRSGLDGVPVIMLGDLAVCTVSAQDAAASGKSEQALAQDWLAILQTTLTQAKQVPAASATGHKNSSLSEHAVLLLFLEIALLLLASLVFGELFVRLGQPAIIGQIVAGLVLGQTFFGTFFPDFSSLLFPQNGSQSKLIEVISWIGVSFLLMLTGMETDISKLKRLGKPALSIAIIGLIGPLLVGCAVSLLLPGELLSDPHQRLAFAVFLGTLFAASSVLVVATVLTDMKVIKRDIGQLVLSVALSHELLCCLLLAVIAVLAGSSSSTGSSRLLIAVAGTICFVAAMYFGRPLFFAILRWVNDKVSTKHGLITAMVVLLLGCAATTQAVGIHIVLGAFAAGVILSQAPVINQKVIRPIETVTMGFFAPIFFASAGLNVNLTTLLSPELAMITAAVTLAAIVSKLASCYLAGKLTGLGKWQSLSVGVSANARGSMGLILALLGNSLNIITADMFAIVIFVALLSTAIAPLLMKWTLGKVRATEEEKLRMAKDERLARTMLSTIRRVLWPTSGQGRNRFIAKFLDSIGKRQVIEATVFWVKSAGVPTERPFANVSQAINRKHVGLLKRTVKSEVPTEAIAEEANRGYDLLLMSTDKPTADADHVFGNLVDNVILNTSTRVLVVYEPEQKSEREIKKVLVPVSGTELSVSTGEFGISLANSLNAKITCLYIGDSESQDLYSDKTRSGEKIERNITNEIEGTLAELARALDVDFDAVMMQAGKHPAQAIILAAQRKDIDLIVLAAEPKLGKGLFLGHTINYILRHAPCTIAVLKLQG